MKTTKTKIVCDLCGGLPVSAHMRCETHGFDLCELHMRTHFDRGTCRLVPVEKELTEMD